MKVNPTWHKKKTKSPFKRALFLLIIFSVTGIFFWYNTKHRFENILLENSIIDTKQTLSKEQRKIFSTLFEHFEKQYGFKIQIAINPTKRMPTPLQNTLFISINTIDKNATLLYPSLLSKALSSKEKETLKEDLINALQAVDWINEIHLVLEHLYFSLEDKENA